MKILVLGIALALFSGTSIFSIEKCEMYITDNESSAKIYLDQNINEVLKILGNPIEQKLVKKDGDEPGFYNLIYSGIIIGYYEHDLLVSNFVISSSRYSIFNGCTIGNTRAEILDRNGKPDFSDNELIMYTYKKASKKPWLEENYILGFRFHADDMVFTIIFQSQ